jgi:uncharacterized protein YkwD
LFLWQPGNYIGSFVKNVLPCIDDDQKSRASVEKATEEMAQEKYSNEEYEAFAQRILKYHNEYRKKHHASDLK